MPILHQAASEIIVFMLMAMETVATEEVDVSMEEIVTEDAEAEVDKVEEDMSKEFV